MKRLVIVCAGLLGAAAVLWAQSAITVTIPAQYTNALTAANSALPSPYPTVADYATAQCIGAVAAPSLGQANAKAKADAKKAQVGDWCARWEAGNAGVRNSMCNALPGQGPNCDPVALGICADGGLPPEDMGLSGKIE